MTLEKGTVLGGYRVMGVLGQGGMGVVYEAMQITLNRPVALKVLAPHLSEDVSFRERFRREGQIQAGIDHPNIVTVHEAGESEHGFFIAMRLIRGPNLKDMIVSRELDAGRSLRLLTPIADALDTAHAAGLIHRDIKPQNILVGGRDQAFLADFGLTKALGEKSLTRTGQFVGTFDYISPEQIKGERATAKSDVYALGAVLYECLTGVVPYPKDSEAAVLYAHMADAPPVVTDVRPELPSALDSVLARAMSKDPGERHDSPSELLNETREAFSRKIRAAISPPGPIEVPEETGIRPAEVEVSTREAAQPPADEAEPTVAGTPPAADPTVAGTPPAPETTVAPEEPAEAAAPSPTAASPKVQETGRRDKADAGAAGTRETGRPEEATPTVAAAAGTPAAPPTRAAMPTVKPAGARAPAKAEPPPEAPTARRAPAQGLLAALGALIAVAAAVGFIVGSSGGGDSEADSNVRTAGPLELSYPDGWKEPASPPSIPGLDFGDRIDLAPGDAGPGEGLIAGLTDATGSALLPASFLERLPETPGRSDPVKSEGFEAYRYRRLRPRGFDGEVTLYVAPTTEGVATVACAAGAADTTSFPTRCEDVAATLKLTQGKTFPLGPDKDYEKRLEGAVSRLNDERRAASRRLRGARTARGQAVAARAAARAYRSAAGSLRSPKPSPVVSGANDTLVRTLTRTARAYTSLAAAARRRDAGAYGRARRQIASGESAVSRALRRAGG